MTNTERTRTFEYLAATILLLVWIYEGLKLFLNYTGIWGVVILAVDLICVGVVYLLASRAPRFTDHRPPEEQLGDNDVPPQASDNPYDTRFRTRTGRTSTQSQGDNRIMVTTLSRPNPHRDTYRFIVATLIFIGLLATRGAVFNLIDPIHYNHYSAIMGVLGIITALFSVVIFLFASRRAGFYTLTLAMILAGCIIAPHVGLVTAILGTFFYFGWATGNKQLWVLGTILTGTSFWLAQYIWPTGGLLAIAAVCFGTGIVLADRLQSRTSEVAVAALIGLGLTGTAHAQHESMPTQVAPPTLAYNMELVPSKIKEQCTASNDGSEYNIYRAEVVDNTMTPFSLTLYEAKDSSPFEIHLLVTVPNYAVTITIDEEGRLLSLNDNEKETASLVRSPNPDTFEAAYALADDCLGFFMNNRAAIVTKLHDARRGIRYSEIRNMTPEEATKTNRASLYAGLFAIILVIGCVIFIRHRH